VFRYNRRFHRHVSFKTVHALAAHRGPETRATPAHQAANRNDLLCIDRPSQRDTPPRHLAATGDQESWLDHELTLNPTTRPELESIRSGSNSWSSKDHN
jgi:hypothetical protein